MDDMGGLTKSRLLQSALTDLDLAAFARHCADPDYRHVLLPTDFFSWLKGYFAKPDTFAFYRLQDHLSVLVSQYGRLRLRLEAIFNLLSHGNTDDQLLRDWAHKVLFEASADPRLLHTSDDGRALVDMSLIYFQPSEFHQRIVPFVLHNLAQRTTCVDDQTEVWAIGFLSRIYEKGFTRLFQDIPAKDAFHPVAAAFLQVDRLCSQIRCPASSTPSPPLDNSLAPAPAAVLPLPARDLAQFVCNLVNMELYSHLADFIRHTSTSAGQIPSAAEFARFWLPFLHELVATMRRSFIPMPAKQYQPLFAAVLENYAWRCPPPDWAELRAEIFRFDQTLLREILADGYDGLVKLAWTDGDQQGGAGHVVAGALTPPTSGTGLAPPPPLLKRERSEEGHEMHKPMAGERAGGVKEEASMFVPRSHSAAPAASASASSSSSSAANPPGGARVVHHPAVASSSSSSGARALSSSSAAGTHPFLDPRLAGPAGGGPAAARVHPAYAMQQRGGAAAPDGGSRDPLASRNGNAPPTATATAPSAAVKAAPTEEEEMEGLRRLLALAVENDANGQARPAKRVKDESRAEEGLVKEEDPGGRPRGRV